jgi:phospholipid/cholesterol/gamma-HCH transport system ATP-binding protein
MDGHELLRVERLSFKDELGGNLQDVSFDLRVGESLVIFGPERSGIELICPIIARLEDQFEGEIYFKGRSIETYDYIETHNYRKELGYLQRDCGLINNMTVEENIALPLKYHSRLSGQEIMSVVDRFIEELHLQRCRRLRPVSLLKSEELRAAYARAVALDPELTLVEHALDGQCLFNSRLFLDSVKKRSLQGDRALLYVTYQPEQFLDFAGRFIMFYDGRIVFEGAKEEFASSTNDYLVQYRRSSIDGPMRIS